MMKEGMGTPKMEQKKSPEDLKRAEAKAIVEKVVEDAAAMGISLTENQKTNLVGQLTEYYKTLMDQVEGGSLDSGDLDLMMIQKIIEKAASFDSVDSEKAAAYSSLEPEQKADLDAKKEIYRQQLIKGKPAPMLLEDPIKEPISLDDRKAAYRKKLGYPEPSDRAEAA